MNSIPTTPGNNTPALKVWHAPTVTLLSRYNVAGGASVNVRESTGHNGSKSVNNHVNYGASKPFHNHPDVGDNSAANWTDAAVS